MLPEKLSTDLTSLGYREDRPAIVIEMVFGEDGSLRSSDLYGATVRNRAKLAYNSVAAWLEGEGPAPGPIAVVEGLAENLRIQDRVAQRLKAFRHEHGALDLETIEARPVFDGDVIRDLEAERRNRAKELIEDFMIAANGVTARYLMARKYPSLRRVVRSPKRGERIFEVASRYGATLPPEPDPKALGQFLAGRKAADPLRFPDLSLTIIKLMGAGEYVPEFPDETAPGHFGLAVRDYTHSPAPNRRYPDLITQRLLKAAIAGSPMPYGRDELTELGRHCTEKEDDANKVERLVRKSAAAMLLAPRTGERFDALAGRGKRMANKRKIALFAAGGLFALLLLAAVALLLFVDVNAHKPRLEAAASDALGMEVRIGGRMGIGLFPGVHVTINDVRTRNRGGDV